MLRTACKRGFHRKAFIRYIPHGSMTKAGVFTMRSYDLIYQEKEGDAWVS